MSERVFAFDAHRRQMLAAEARQRWSGMDVVKQVRRRAPDSTPEPDMFRNFVVWPADGVEAWSVLDSLMWAFFARELVMEDFAVALFAFLHDGDVQSGLVGAKRKASAPRPIGLMNAYAKVIQASVSHSLAGHIASHHACPGVAE